MPPVPPRPRQSAEQLNRRLPLLEAAARHFATRGFETASLREIAADAGMLAGSIYYHFKSKDELIAAVYELGVDQIVVAADRAIQGLDDPWARLEAGMAAHLEALLAESPFAAVLTADLRLLRPALRAALVRLRDRYEGLFSDLVDGLPIPPEIDRGLLRLGLLGALNWTPTWFRRDGRTPAHIARAYVGMLRRS